MSLHTFRSPPRDSGWGPRRPSWPRRLVSHVAFAIRYTAFRVRIFVKRMPVWQRLLGLASILALVCAGAALWARHNEKERISSGTVQQWKDFDRCADQIDTSAMLEALDKIDLLKQGDPLVQRRREALKKGEADSDDQVMLAYFINLYIVKGRIHDAAREARKRIETVPDDWQANCALAHEAWIESQCPAYRGGAFFGPASILALRGWAEDQRAIGIEYLKQLPSPMSGRHPIGVGGLQYGFAIFRLYGYDDAALRACRHDLVIPKLRSLDLGAQPRGLIFSLLDMYRRALAEDIVSFADLPSFWVGASRAAQYLLEEPSMTPAELTALGNIQESLLQTVETLVRKQVLTPERARPMQSELRERLAEIWAKVVDAEPANADGVMGLTRSQWVGGDPWVALNTLRRGERASTDGQSRLRLYSFEFDLVRALYSSTEALKRFEEIAGQYPEDPALQRLLVEAAKNAGRLDRVLRVCERARKLVPDAAWPLIELARVYVDKEDQVRSFETLATLEGLLVRDPDVTALFIRAYSNAGSNYQIRPLLDRVAAEAQSAEQACPPLNAALRLGYVDAVAAAATMLTRRFPTYHKELWRLLGESHLSLAEPTGDSKGWNDAHLRAALQAFETIQAAEPLDLNIVHSLVYLQLYGLKAADTADSSAEPLREAYKAGNLPLSMFDTLAAVELTRRRYEEALRLLNRVVKDEPSASAYVHLALCCYHLSMIDEARRALRQASSMRRSPHISSELKYATSVIDGPKS